MNKTIKKCFCTKRGNKCMYHATLEKTTLNPDNTPVKGEKVIDIYTNNLGTYCGSFCVPQKDAERYQFAINQAGSLLIKGIQTNRKPIIAKIRNKK